MRDALHEYLLERPGGATPSELLDLIFTRPAADREFGPRFLELLLAEDRRFAFRRDQGRWIATMHETLQRDLGEASFVVIDIETTGGAPARGDRIIEMGAVRLRGGRIIGRFQTLVDPERRVPPFISRLTGITQEMVAGQPKIADALADLLAFVADDVLVAHNAAFDLPFLDAMLQVHAGRRLERPHLCTLRLSRRLLPQLRRRSLDALAGHLGVPVVDRHRALGDANATAEIFFHLLELLRRRGILRLSEALDFQHRASDGRRFLCLLPRAEVERLPARPGVYRFFDADGRLLYVGKAKSLRQRVGSYLSNSTAHRPKTLDLIRHVRRVTADECGSELDAALSEAETIRRLKPPYNRLGKHLPRIAFVRLDAADAFPRLLVTARLGKGRARLLGPFHGRESARETLAVLARLFRLRTCTGRLRPDPTAAGCFQGQIGACSLPCRSAADREEYGRQVERVLAVFDGRMDEARAELERRRQAAADAMRFESAQKHQRDLELLRRLERRQRTLGWLLERRHCVVLQPDVRGGAVLVYVAVHGRLVERRRIEHAGDLAGIARRMDALCAEHPRAADADSVDATVILAAWLRARGERDGYVFPLEGGETAEGQLPGWTAALESLLAVRSDADAR